MASILDRYGIKEVADVTFYKINSDGSVGEPVLFLDTLKVSTIEQTAESVDARGGKGNPKLITWDYGKEITVNIEDALFSPKSMAIMFGNGVAEAKTSGTVTRTVTARVGANGKIDYINCDVYDSTTGGAVRKKVDLSADASDSAGVGKIAFASAGITVTKITKENGEAYSSSSSYDYTTIQAAATSNAGSKLFITYTQPVMQSTITINGDTFPGTYYVTGDTYARSDVDGSDSFFQFIIEKAKMSAENTITLEAEGDPSTFNMNLTVLRPESGDMMKLVQYDLTAPSSGNGG